MSALAAIRPDELDLPLFVHVLGAMALVGALATAATYLFLAQRDGSVRATRVGFRALLYAALPAFVVMRVGAQWIADEEMVADSDEAWIGIGYITSDLGLLLFVVATVAAGLGLRRGGRGVTLAAWISALLILVYVVAIWAMATKPS